MIYKIIEFKTYKQYNFSTFVNGSKVRIHVRYNDYLDRYYINIDRYVNNQYINIIKSVMLYTGVDILFQHPQFNLGKLFVIPTKKELYSEDPKSSTIQNYLLFWESNT